MSKQGNIVNLDTCQASSAKIKVGHFVQPIAILFASFLIGFSSPSAAQQLNDDSEQPRPPAALIQEAKEYYGIGSVPDHCADNEGNPDDIVVCAKPRTDQRLPIEEPVSGKVDSKMTAVGVNPGPNGIPIKGCFLQKCPKELYIIDVKALPEAPPGSDADLVARGER